MYPRNIFKGLIDAIQYILTDKSDLTLKSIKCRLYCLYYKGTLLFKLCIRLYKQLTVDLLTDYILFKMCRSNLLKIISTGHAII